MKRGRCLYKLQFVTPLRLLRLFCYNPAIQLQGSADAERGPGSQEPGS